MKNLQGSNDTIVSRAQGCLLGQLAGDALRSLVEFQTPVQIRQEYPNGVRELADGGTWNTIAGYLAKLAEDNGNGGAAAGETDGTRAWQ